MEQIMVYDNIKRRAKAAGISINSIERQTGLAIGSICKWNVVSPTAGSLLKVAAVLGTSVDELLLARHPADATALRKKDTV